MIFDIIVGNYLYEKSKNNNIINKQTNNKLKFDIIIGNPPYQINDGGGGQGASSSPIYHAFVDKNIKLSPKYLMMIIPSKWFVGGKVPTSFRKQMMNDKHIKYLYEFINENDCFSNVNIAGGVNYFLRDKCYEGKSHIITINNTINDDYEESIRFLKEDNLDIFIRYHKGIDIINSITQKHKGKYFNTIVSKRNVFGFATSYRGCQNGNIILYHSRCEALTTTKDIKYNLDYVNKYKVYVSYANGNAIKAKPYNVISKPFFGDINTVCTDTYLVVGSDIINNKSEAYNLISYMKTKFFRFLLFLKKMTPVASSDCYSFIPIQDFSKQWTDDELYILYNLSQESINYIESTIKTME